jgi:Icc-related predicted phosphoesterase
MKRGAPIQRCWNMIPKGVDIIMTHGPVHGILDAVINGNNAGCLDLCNKVFEVKPKVHICGHIHEGYGWVKRLGIRFINASLQNEMYELVNKPVSFELKPGGTVERLSFG